MNLRLVLQELAAQHGLDAAGAKRLQEFAGLPFEPRGLARGLPRSLAVLAAALVGLGLVMWVAANWQTWGRMSQFGLLIAWVAAATLGAALWRRARVAIALLTFVGIGALFAFFGQTYQTGADPWQLFALWAALALPLCWGVRSDVLWTPWVLLAMTAVSLWTHAHAGHRWSLEAPSLWPYLASWLSLVAIAVAASPAFARFMGGGPWAFRLAVVLSVMQIGFWGVAGAMQTRVAPHYVMALLLLTVAAWPLTRSRWFDVFALSAVALGLIPLVTAGLGRLLVRSGGGHELGLLFILGTVAAGLLAAAVAGILRLHRRFGDEGANERRAWMNA